MMNAKTKNALLLISRILISGIFLWSAWGKLNNLEATAAFTGFTDWQIFGSALVEVIGGLLLLFGGCIHTGSLVLAVYVILVTLWVHLPLSAGDLENSVHFLKNLAIVGGLISLMITGGGKYQVYQCRCDA